MVAREAQRLFLRAPNLIEAEQSRWDRDVRDSTKCRGVPTRALHMLARRISRSTRANCACGAQGDRAPGRLLNGRVRLLFQGLSQKARNHHARVADQAIQTRAAAVRRMAHHSVLGKRLIRLLRTAKVMRQLPLEFGEVA